jgi:hypothetical protein
MELSRLLGDFMLGAALGDKESEDWALALLGPYVNSMSMFEPDDPSALLQGFEDLPLDRRAPDDPREQSALLARIHKERLQRTLEREVYPRIGDDRFKPDGTLKQHWRDFDTPRWQKIVRAMEERQITSYDNAVKYVEKQEAERRAREAKLERTREQRASARGPGAPPRREQVMARMDPKEAARAGTGPPSAWTIGAYYPGSAYDVLLKEPLVGSAERYGYRAGLHDAGQASDWDLIRDGALFGTQLGLTAADIFGVGKIPYEAVKQGAFRPFHRYVAAGKSRTGPWLTRGRKPPYGEDMAKAKDTLSMPETPRSVEKDIPVPFHEPVAGPRPARPKYGGRGGGPEFLRGIEQARQKLREGDVVGAIRSLSLPKEPMTSQQKKEFAEFLAREGILEPDNWSVIASLLPSLPVEEQEDYVRELEAAAGASSAERPATAQGTPVAAPAPVRQQAAAAQPRPRQVGQGRAPRPAGPPAERAAAAPRKPRPQPRPQRQEREPMRFPVFDEYGAAEGARVCLAADYDPRVTANMLRQQFGGSKEEALEFVRSLEPVGKYDYMTKARAYRMRLQRGFEPTHTP